MTKGSKLGVAALVIVVLLAAGVVYVWLSLDRIVAAAIEKYGSQATQTQVKVSGVDIALTKGQAAIAGLTVANPKGFDTAHAFELGEIRVRIDTGTITASPVVIETVEVRAPGVTYEVNKDGRSNILELKKNIGAAQGSSEEQPDAGEPIKLIIRRLVVAEGTVRGHAPGLEGKDLTARLPRIELVDLGARTNGATPAALAREIAAVLAQQASTVAVNMGLQRYLGKSTEELRRELEDKAKDKLREKLDVDRLFQR